MAPDALRSGGPPAYRLKARDKPYWLTGTSRTTCARPRWSTTKGIELLTWVPSSKVITTLSAPETKSGPAMIKGIHALRYASATASDAEWAL